MKNRRNWALLVPSALVAMGVLSACDVDDTCTTDSDCEADETCVIESGAEEGSCEAQAAPTGCAADSDCSGDQVCDTATEECVDPPGCTDNSECDGMSFQACVDGACAAPTWRYVAVTSEVPDGSDITVTVSGTFNGEAKVLADAVAEVEDGEVIANAGADSLTVISLALGALLLGGGILAVSRRRTNAKV